VAVVVRYAFSGGEFCRYILPFSFHHLSGHLEIGVSLLYLTVGVCVDDGWFEQPYLSESDWTLGLCEAAHLLHIELSVCTG
jgi:hypothetical protein